MPKTKGGADRRPLAPAGLLGAEEVHVDESRAALDAVGVHVAVAVSAAVVGPHAADADGVVGEVVVGPHDEAAADQPADRCTEQVLPVAAVLSGVP